MKRKDDSPLGPWPHDRLDAQSRSLLVLLAGALLAGGIVQLATWRPLSHATTAERFAYDGVAVFAPQYVVRGPIDVNAADMDGLVNLPGIGPVLAARIVSDREAHGPFDDLDALERVRGIGPATIDVLREEACAGCLDQ